MKLNLSLFIIVLFCSPIFAQQSGNTQITGTIKGAISKNITLITSERYKSTQPHSFDARLNTNDEFSLIFDISEPQIIVLQYGRNIQAPIYIEPGDQLRIDTDGQDFVKSMSFSGLGGTNNQVLKFYRNQHPKDFNQFNEKRYKKGNLYYKVAADLAKQMESLGYPSFTKLMNDDKAAKNATLTSYETSYPEISEGFKQFLRTEIEYDWAYNMLIYGYAFQYKYGIPPSFFEFMNTVLINNDYAMNSPSYRRYIKGFINYKYDKGSNAAANSYIGQYDLASQMLSGKTQAWFRANILTRGINKGKLNELIETYNTYMNTPLSEEYAMPLERKFYEKNRYAVGSPAPNFDLIDLNGQRVTMGNFRDKVVYIDFWATWCPPCMRKLEIINQVNQEINTPEVVFIHISLDRTEADWRNGVANTNASGIHLYAGGAYDTEVAQKFGVIAIPEYFIIDQYGNFTAKPSTVNARTLKKYLEEKASAQ